MATLFNLSKEIFMIVKRFLIIFIEVSPYADGNVFDNNGNLHRY